jgi:tetratricopeptide (TPR) repeat protein
VPERQQTMRATIAWSYDLLNTSEKDVLRRLSVFPGDFSLTAATAVGGIPDAATLDLLTSLVEKNLLRNADGFEDEPRFRMLETVREFLHEQLESAGEAEAHTRFFLTLVEEAAPHIRQPERDVWIHRIEREMHNLRAIIAWTNATTDGDNTTVRIIRSLGFVYWRICGHLHEGLRWCERALEAASPGRATLLWIGGGLAGYMGRLPSAKRWLEESARLAREAQAELDLGYALVLLGFVESHLSDPGTAAHLDQGIATLRRVGDRNDLVLGLAVVIAPYVEVGDVTTARVVLAECLSLATELGDEWLIGEAHSSAGFLETTERNWRAARAHNEEALAIFARLGDEGSIAILYNNLGVTSREGGDVARAMEFFLRSVASTSASG